MSSPTPSGSVAPWRFFVDVQNVFTVATLLQVIVDGLATLNGQSLANAVVTISPGRVRLRR